MPEATCTGFVRSRLSGISLMIEADFRVCTLVRYETPDSSSSSSFRSDVRVESAPALSREERRPSNDRCA